MRKWQIQQAKAHFSDLVKCAQQQGPQEITTHGKPVAVLVSKETFDRLSGTSESLLAFMQRSPLAECPELEFERDSSPPREVEL